MGMLNRILLITLVIWAGSVRAGEPPVVTRTADALPRVAVLCEQQDTELLGLSEQVEVLLAQRNDLAMLDRANMDQLLREQGLMARQGQDMETIVRIGKLLRTDLLVVAGKYEGFFAWRFVDVKNGVLAGLQVTRWPTERRTAAVSEVEQAITSATRQLGDASVEGKRYLSIVRFVNQDLSRQYDSLEEVLPVLLSAQLASQPSIGLVERSRLSNVAEEKIGTEGVEGEYKAGTLIVKGEISVLRSNATPSVSVKVSAGKPNQPAHIHFICTGPMGDLPSLARSMTEGLLKAMEVKTQEGSQAAAPSEADTFYMKGNFFMMQNDFRSAVSLYETSCTLNPGESTYRNAFVNARRNILKANLPQEIKLHYYIQEVTEWEQNIRNAQTRIEDITLNHFESWFDTSCLLGVPDDSPLAPLQNRAVAAFKASLNLALESCEKQRNPPMITLRMGIEKALFDHTVFRDPHEFCQFIRRLVDFEHLLRSEGRFKKSDEFSIGGILSIFARKHLKPVVGTRLGVCDEYARTVFDSLTNDARPLLRIHAYLALILHDYESRYNEREWFVADGRPDVIQAIVNQLAVWTLPYLPGEYSPVGFPFYRKLDWAMKGKPFDAIRSALKEPGATYTPALDGVVQQALLMYHREGFRDVPFPYHDWTDVLCLHLDHLLQRGQKDVVLQRAQKVFSRESESKDVLQATSCINQVKAVLEKYAVDYSSITNISRPVVVTITPPPRVLGHPVAWHLNDSDIQKESICLHRSQISVEDGKVEYVIINRLSDVLRDESSAYVFDVATGRLLSKKTSTNNLFRLDPELGMPPQEVRSWCKVKKAYYVGCDGGFGKYEKGQFTQICNSRKLDDSYPLSGGALYSVMGMRADPSETKLYLVVKDGGARAGVWEHDLPTGEQRQIITLKEHPYNGFTKCEVKERFIFVEGGSWRLIFDTHAPDDSCLVVENRAKSFKTLNIRDIRWTDHLMCILKSSAATPEVFLFTPFYEANRTFVWHRGEKEPREIVIVTKKGEEVSPPRNKFKEINKWVAVPQGFIYQLNDGSIGLLTDWGPKAAPNPEEGK